MGFAEVATSFRQGSRQRDKIEDMRLFGGLEACHREADCPSL